MDDEYWKFMEGTINKKKHVFLFITILLKILQSFFDSLHEADPVISSFCKIFASVMFCFAFVFF